MAGSTYLGDHPIAIGRNQGFLLFIVGKILIFIDSHHVSTSHLG
jgi:hypothetical protein